MIHVDPVEEPADFNVRVRQPGHAYLEFVAAATPDFIGRDYWRRCLDQLREAYRGTCAYTATYIEAVTGAQSVDHFVPKRIDPHQAYEWSNFRYVCGRMNSRKRIDVAIIDPFLIDGDIFFLEFVSMLMIVNPAVPYEVAERAHVTIDVLGLNDERCTTDRLNWVINLANGDVSADYVARRAPFIDRELRRQGLDAPALRDMMAKRP